MFMVLMLACTGPEDTGPSGAGDTQRPLDPDLSFELSGDWDGGTLALVRIGPNGGEGPMLGDLWQAWVPEVATFGVQAGAPPEEHLEAVDPEDNPDWSIAVYIVALFDDADHDGTHDEGELVLGVSPQWVVYSSGPLPADEVIPDLVDGWNGYEPQLQVGPGGVAADPQTIPMPANLKSNETITFAGENTLDTDMDLRLVAIPGVVLDSAKVETLLYDEELGSTWSVTFEGDPPQDHRQQLDHLGFGAYEVMLAYADNNSSGTYDEGDSTVATACRGGNGALVVWIPEVVRLDSAWALAMDGIGTGWTLLLSDGATGTPIALDEADYGSLVIDEDCTTG